MKIIEDVRQHSAEQAVSEEEAIQKGIAEKLKEFAEAGAKVYVPA
jgi:phosphomethylpyrimidine synthase